MLRKTGNDKELKFIRNHTENYKKSLFDYCLIDDPVLIFSFLSKS